MSETAAEDSTGGTGSVEGGRVHLDLPGRLGRSRNEDVLPGSEGVHIRGDGARASVKHFLEREGLGRDGGGVEEARDQRVARGFLGDRHGRS